MNRSPRPTPIALAALFALPSGCIVEKQLDPDGADTHGATTGVSTADDFGGSTEASYEEDHSSSISATVTGAIEQDTDGGPALCADLDPFDLPCQDKGSAVAEVTGDALPNLEAEPCTVLSVESVASTTDRMTLSCSSTYLIDISTTPYLPLPIVGGQHVLLTSVTALEPFDSPGSFTIHTTTGNLLLAHVHAPHVPQGLDLAPFTPMPAISGCSAVPLSAHCEPGGSVLAQRRLVSFPTNDTTIFDGNVDSLTANGDTMHVIVSEAMQVICWDSGCALSDAEPDARLQMLFVAEPS